MTTPPVPSDTKKCAKCGRTGTRQFTAEGDAWVCSSKWSCQGRIDEANATPPAEATCHKCGRTGVRDFVFDTKAQAPKCSSWGACSDRQREAGFKETAEDLNTPDSVQGNVNAVPSDTDRLDEIRANCEYFISVNDALWLLDLAASLQGRLDTAEGQLGSGEEEWAIRVVTSPGGTRSYHNYCDPEDAERSLALTLQVLADGHDGFGNPVPHGPVTIVRRTVWSTEWETVDAAGLGEGDGQ